MKNQLVALGLGFSALSCWNATAGVISGGGGGAFVCRDGANQVVAVELVDLFEAEANGITIHYDDGVPVAAQVAAAIQKLSPIYPAFAEQVQKEWTIVQARQAGGPDVVVDTPTDVDKHYSKRGCSLEGMMYFDDVRGNLIINTSLFQLQKTKTDFAASYLHEAIYKAMRDESLPGAVDSTLTRRIVGCLVSDQDLGLCLGLAKPQIPTKAEAWSCGLPIDGIGLIDFNLFRTDRTSANWYFVLNSIDGAAFSYRPQGYFISGITLPIQTDPSQPPVPADQLDLHLIESVSIGGLKGLGSPIGPGVVMTEVKSLKPLTIEFEGGQQKFVCKKIQ